MVRSRQLTPASTRSGAVKLVVTAVERSHEADGTVHLRALHGVNGARGWRLTLSEAIAALGTGRYVFEVEHQGQRRRAEVLGADGATRLCAPSSDGGDLLEALPEWGAAAADAGAPGPGRREAVTPDGAGA